MQGHRGLLLGLATSALLGLMGNQARGGALTVSVDLNGTVIYSVVSTSPDHVVTYTKSDITALNAALSSAGSAYQFSALFASTNYVGSSSAIMNSDGSIYMTPTGTTTAVLSVDVTQTGFLSPLGSGYANCIENGNSVDAAGTMTIGNVAGTAIPNMYINLAFSMPNGTPPPFIFNLPPHVPTSPLPI